MVRMDEKAPVLNGRTSTAMERSGGEDGRLHLVFQLTSNTERNDV